MAQSYFTRRFLHLERALESTYHVRRVYVPISIDRRKESEAYKYRSRKHKCVQRDARVCCF